MMSSRDTLPEAQRPTPDQIDALLRKRELNDDPPLAAVPAGNKTRPATSVFSQDRSSYHGGRESTMDAFAAASNASRAPSQMIASDAATLYRPTSSVEGDGGRTSRYLSSLPGSLYRTMESSPRPQAVSNNGEEEEDADLSDMAGEFEEQIDSIWDRGRASTVI